MTPRPWVNYHHLLYFKTIAIEGGIAKAAKKLRLGQPTLSTQMKQFEDTLGQELFDRSKRHLQLTDAGRLVLGYAAEIFRLGDEMIDALFDQHKSTRVQVQLGAADTVPKHLVLDLFHHARRSYDCVVSITEGHGEELLLELQAHRIDLVISNYPPPVGDTASFFAKSIARMPVSIFGAPQFQHLKTDFPQSLRGQPFVMPSLQSKLRHDVEHFLKLKDIEVLTCAEVQDSSLQNLLAIHGDGLLPAAWLSGMASEGQPKLVELGQLEGVHEELWLIAAQRRIQNPVAASLLKDFSLSSDSAD